MKRFSFSSVFLIFFSTVCFAQNDWKTTPLTISQTVSAGDTIYGSFTVYNESDRTKTFRTNLNDWTIEEDGKEPEFEPGSVARGCASWITYSPRDFAVAPHSSQIVRVMTIVPKTVTAGNYWGAIFVVDQEKQLASQLGQPGKSFTMYVNLRNRVTFRYTVLGNLVRSGEIQNALVSLDAMDILNIRTTFLNTGNMILNCTGSIDIRDAMGNDVTSFPLDDFFCMPGNKRTIAMKQPMRLPPGEYTALIVIDFNGDFLVAGEALFKKY